MIPDWQPLTLCRLPRYKVRARYQDGTVEVIDYVSAVDFAKRGSRWLLDPDPKAEKNRCGNVRIGVTR